MANISAADISYINAHGTSTPANDLSETKAIKFALGEAAYNVAISSTKSYVGHMYGASGGAEAVVTVQSLMHDFIHPTLNLRSHDPECDLDYVPLTGRTQTIQYALSNSMGFGGHNGSLLFKNWND